VERIEKLLREELKRAEAKGVAPTGVMLARVARARRRRTTAAAAGAGVAVVLAGAALIGPLGFGGRAPAGAEPEPEPPSYRNELLRVVFTDRNHGYVLQRRCTTTFPQGRDFIGGETPPTVHDCAAQLLATADGGRDWRERLLPTDPGTPDKYRDPSGRSLAFWSAGGGTIAVAGNDMRYWTSADGGVTWTLSPDLRDGGPAGAAGVVGPREQQAFLTPPAGGLTVKEGTNQIAASTDGTFWRACSDRSCGMVTRDLGATWETLAIGSGAEAVDWVASYDGETVYASVGPAIMRSTDGGARWSEVARRVGSERSVAGVVMPDGDLVLTEGRDGRAFRVAAGTTSLERLPDLPQTAGYLYRTGYWLVASQGVEARDGDPDLGPIVLVSPDKGTTWQTIPPPAAP